MGKRRARVRVIVVHRCWDPESLKQMHEAVDPWIGAGITRAIARPGGMIAAKWLGGAGPRPLQQEQAKTSKIKSHGQMALAEHTGCKLHSET